MAVFSYSAQRSKCKIQFGWLNLIHENKIYSKLHLEAPALLLEFTRRKNPSCVIFNSNQDSYCNSYFIYMVLYRHYWVHYFLHYPQCSFRYLMI